MAVALSPNLTIALNRRCLPPASFPFPETIRSGIQLAAKPSLIVRCSVEGDVESESLKGALSNLVGEQVEELLNREENRELLENLTAASERVEKARKDLADIEKRSIEARLTKEYIQKMEARAAEIAECQREVEEARAMVEEAELSLSDADSGERLESVKAAVISAFVGTLASLPISAVQAKNLPELILPVSITFLSCALFGVTFRYAVRRDVGNFQLKTGTAAAFGVVKGLGSLNGGLPLELNSESLVAHVVKGALLVSQELVVFSFAAVGLDLCFKLRFLSPFPSKGSSEEINQW